MPCCQSGRAKTLGATSFSSVFQLGIVMMISFRRNYWSNHSPSYPDSLNRRSNWTVGLRGLVSLMSESVTSSQSWLSTLRRGGYRIYVESHNACLTWPVSRLVRSKTKDRKCRRDLFELRKRCILVHGHVGSRSRCSLQVRLQDGCALVDGNLFELDLLTAAAPENRLSTGCAYVLDPLHVLSEHRHQVPLPIDDGHDHRQRDRSAPTFVRSLPMSRVVGRDARGGYSSRRSIQNPRDPVGSLPTVQPSSEVA